MEQFLEDYIQWSR